MMLVKCAHCPNEHDPLNGGWICSGCGRGICTLCAERRMDGASECPAEEPDIDFEYELSLED